MRDPGRTLRFQGGAKVSNPISQTKWEAKA